MYIEFADGNMIHTTGITFSEDNTQIMWRVKYGSKLPFRANIGRVIQIADTREGLKNPDLVELTDKDDLGDYVDGEY